MKGKSKLERQLKEGIIKVKYAKDNLGFYIPYCRYQIHPGIIEPETAEICIGRKCFYYKRLYVK